MVVTSDALRFCPPGTPPPDGWVCRQVDWFGEPWVAAFDPERVMLFRGIDLTDQTRQLLLDKGCEPVITGSRGESLWVVTTSRQHTAKLDQLATRQPPSGREPGLGI